MKNVYLQILQNRKSVSELVIATVTGTSGSTPQKAGSSALFTRSGLIYGTVGGGILEGKVQEIAKKSAVSKISGQFVFRLDRSVEEGEDALCGGKIKILLDADLERHLAVFKEIENSVRKRMPGILITIVKGDEGENVLIERYWLKNGWVFSSLPPILQVIEPELTSMLSDLNHDDFREIIPEKSLNKSVLSFYLEPIIPPIRLIIAGAGHIGKALSKIGQMLDFDVTVIDDRPEFANLENIPFADHIIVGEIGKAIADIEKSQDTYLVIVTRGHKDDAAALRSCIGSNAAYIGMIGSRNKVSLMHRDFIEKSWATEEQWNKIYAPVGVDINSKTVEEIAVSIAAQLIQVKNTKSKKLSA